MTYRKKYLEIKNIDNKYINGNVITSLLCEDGGFISYTDLVKHFEDEVKDEKTINEKLGRILNGEPMQYVLGYAYFIDGNYKVTPDTLIPRQETEQLAATALKEIIRRFGNKEIVIADIGTGSGILAIYLKNRLPNAKVIAIDISKECIEVAKENAKKFNVDIDFRLGNMMDPINEKLDVVISNPPYIESKETVDEQTLKYEPHLALFAKPKTKFYEEILSNMNKMKDEFFMAFEIGEDMKSELTNILEDKYQGLGYSFDEDIYYKTRFLYIYKFKDLDKYE